METNSQIGRLADRAFELEQEGRVAEAMGCYDPLLDLPEVAGVFRGKVLYNKGLALYTLLRHEEAVGCFREALAAPGIPDEQRAWTLMNLGVTLDELGSSQ